MKIWHEQKKTYVRDGFDAPGAHEKVRLYDRYLKKMEDALSDSDWLAGDFFSFADIAMTPYVVRLDMLSMDGMWANGRLPRVESWLAAVKARPTFHTTFIEWMPDQLLEDLKSNGAKSWPQAKALLDAA